MIWLVSRKRFGAKAGSLFSFFVISLLFTIFYFPNIAWGQDKRFEFTENHMGSPFKVVFYASSDSLAEKASQAVFKRISALNEIMSDYRDGSEINLLSQSAGLSTPIKASPDLLDIVSTSLFISRNTAGTFDITLGPVVQLWRHSMRFKRFPPQQDIKKALKKTGYKKIKLDAKNSTILLTRTGMRLDLGAIGKGYAADEGMATLRKFGITAALVDAGGDLTIGSPPPGKKGWSIDVNSGTHDDSVKILELSNVGIATSGANYRFLEYKGQQYSHIVDPKTGIGLTNHVRSTVIAPNGTLADALATALSVASPKQRKQIVKNFPSVKVWLLETNKPENTSWSYGF